MEFCESVCGRVCVGWGWGVWGGGVGKVRGAQRGHQGLLACAQKGSTAAASRLRRSCCHMQELCWGMFRLLAECLSHTAHVGTHVHYRAGVVTLVATLVNNGQWAVHLLSTMWSLTASLLAESLDALEPA